MNFPLHNKPDIFCIILENIIPNACLYDDFATYMNLTALGKTNYINQDFLNTIKYASFDLKKKHKIINNYQSNLFLTKEQRNLLTDYFCTAQKTLYGLNRFARIIKYKKYIHYCSATDLCLEPLSNMNSRFIIPIHQGKTIYKFRIHDLVRLIENGLIYAPDLFSDPQIAKNPYTNLEFSICHLYQIYFHMVEIKMKIPTIFHLYYISGFDMTVLLDNYESVLRDKSIQKNTEGMDEDDKYDEILDMLDKHKRVMKSIIIQDNFPMEKTVEQFQHVLLNFMYSKYSYNPSLKLKKRRRVISQLIQINKENPLFGRVIVKLRRRIDISGNILAPIIRNNIIVIPDNNDSDVDSDGDSGVDGDSDSDGDVDVDNDIILSNVISNHVDDILLNNNIDVGVDNDVDNDSDNDSDNDVDIDNDSDIGDILDNIRQHYINQLVYNTEDDMSIVGIGIGTIYNDTNISDINEIDQDVESIASTIIYDSSDEDDIA
tara:strand:- start:948 stop:2411 length:1464 start_codon:yes stop_codon:yes gene_type:complete